MTVKADQVAGGAFIALGIAVFIIGWDLPFGRLSAPGAGMLPKLMAGLMIALAIGIYVMGGKGEKVSDLPWSDWTHASLIVGITAAATAVYSTLGFLITMSLLVFALVAIVERKNLIVAAVYACSLTLFAYWLFGIALKAPLEHGILWF